MCRQRRHAQHAELEVEMGYKNVKKTAILLGLVSVIGLCGCDSKEQKMAQKDTEVIAEKVMQEEAGENIYSEVITSLKEGEYYTCIRIAGYDQPILFVTDGSYTYNDVEAAIWCDVYYIWDGTAMNLGKISSSGTAYPISYDDKGIYTSGGHYAIRYVIDCEAKELVAAEYANETFDSDANVTYVYFDLEDGERVVEDGSYLDAMFEALSDAKVVNFKCVSE